MKCAIELSVFCYEDDQIDHVKLGIEIPFDYDNDKKRPRTYYNIDYIYPYEKDTRCTVVCVGDSDAIVDVNYQYLKEVLENGY